MIADSMIERFSTEMLQWNAFEERTQRTKEQVQFWPFAHGDDWEQVVAADTKLLQRLARQGGDWLNGRLGEIRCPVLLTASLGDTYLPDAAPQVTAMARQIPDCHVFFTNRGGHPLMWSCPQAFRQAADNFLARLDA